MIITTTDLSMRVCDRIRATHVTTVSSSRGVHRTMILYEARCSCGWTYSPQTKKDYARYLGDLHIEYCFQGWKNQP
ncbi:hypothetical protein PP304_gp035 [Gordonia phage Phendrix]|uniref:Uncharacterized protein n=2 Tax=Godonkavirus TaxID=2733178 RepID=A0A4D6E2C4_9CAUD|nr:hypothetical protein HOV33_gp035 [Gordonia phage GodonK]YP_010649079.1 hypothetical protein PP304_gp035 [Gordonia phage Phendrix]QBZ72654.1 hypothetical protein SEA_GODONK_35 [Gordonia phage GodonK]QDK02583.1 hypothetical protein SEA_PHENDRIX_35 [Gordonia phage Phendrix]